MIDKVKSQQRIEFWFLCSCYPKNIQKVFRYISKITIFCCIFWKFWQLFLIP